MKKFLVLILGVVMCLCMVGCGDSGSSDGSGSDDSKPTTKKDLQTANTNAKLVFTTANNAAADVCVEKPDEATAIINAASFGKVVKVEDLKDSDNDIDKAVYDALKDEKGEIYMEGDEQGITLAQWTKKDGCVGQYPDIEPDWEVEHEIGERFEPSKSVV